MAVQVPPVALVKSRLGAPCVTTPILPTVVPAPMVKLSVCAPVAEPIACEPRFALACPGNTPGGVELTSIVPDVAVNEFAASVAVMV